MSVSIIINIKVTTIKEDLFHVEKEQRGSIYIDQKIINIIKISFNKKKTEQNLIEKSFVLFFVLFTEVD